jgi:hypothetical protein
MNIKKGSMMEAKRISIKEAVSFGWNAILLHIRLFSLALLIGVSLIVVAIFFVGLFNKSFIFALLGSPEFQNLQQCISSNCLTIVYESGSSVLGIVSNHFFSLFVSSLLLSIFLVGFDLGFKRVALDIRDRNASVVERLFSAFNLVPQALIAWFLYWLVVSVGWFFFIIPGLIMLLRCAFFPYFIIDKNAGPIAALKMSFHATQGHIWDLFAFWIVMKIIMYLGFLTWIGSLVTWPLSTLAYAFVYRQLISEQPSSTSAF